MDKLVRTGSWQSDLPLHPSCCLDCPGSCGAPQRRDFLACQSKRCSDTTAAFSIALCSAASSPVWQDPRCSLWLMKPEFQENIQDFSPILTFWKQRHISRAQLPETLPVSLTFYVLVAREHSEQNRNYLVSEWKLKVEYIAEGESVMISTCSIHEIRITWRKKEENWVITTRGWRNSFLLCP